MGIGTKCNDGPTQFPVAKNNFTAGIGGVKAVFVSAGVDFQADVITDQTTENSVDVFLITFKRIVFILIRTISYDIIQMTEGIEIGVGFQVLDTAFKIFFVCGGFLPSFEEDRIVGIFSVYEMDGTDDEVKGIGKDQVMMFFCEVWLKSQFNADPEINPVCKLFLKRKQLLEINFRVKFKTEITVRIIIVHMICQAQMGQTERERALNHDSWSNVTVTRERSMHMIVSLYVQKNSPLCKKWFKSRD